MIKRTDRNTVLSAMMTLLISVMVFVNLSGPAMGKGILDSIKNKDKPTGQAEIKTDGAAENQTGESEESFTAKDFVVYKKDTLWDAMKRRFSNAKLTFKDFFNVFFLTRPSVELTARHMLFPPLYAFESFNKSREEFVNRRKARKGAEQAKTESYNQAMEDLKTVLSMKTGDSSQATKNKEAVLNNLLKSGIPPEDVEKYMGHVERKISSLKLAEKREKEGKKKAEEARKRKEEEAKRKAEEKRKRKEEEARRKAEEEQKRKRENAKNTPQRSQLEAANGRYKNYWCGPTSLAMVYEYYGRKETTRDVANRIYDFNGNTGTYAGNIVSDAKRNGFPNTELKTGVDFDFLQNNLNEGRPVIVGVEVSYKYGHYMVVVGLDGDKVILNDPFHPGVRREMSRSAFLTDWNGRWRRSIVLK